MKHHMDHPAAVISLAASFDLPLPQEMKMIGMQAGNPYSPALKKYIFDISRFRDLLTFWQLGFRALKIIGYQSAGKTSIIEQWHARLGMPLFIMSCHENMSEIDFIGQMLPRADGTLMWVDSPPMSVYRHGGSVLLDEWNNLNPNAATLLNAMLEGYAITIPQTGEVITPHPNARYFATQNPIEGKSVVQGRYVQDSASDDRFMEMWVDYLDPELEQDVIIAAVREVDTESTDEAVAQVAAALVSVAGEVRKSFLNNDQPEFAAFQKPMSTRVLARWAKLNWAYRTSKGEHPMLYALRRAFSGINAEMREAVETVVKVKLGIVSQ